MSEFTRLRKLIEAVETMRAGAFTVGDLLDIQKIRTEAEDYPLPWENEAKAAADQLDAIIQRANAGKYQPADDRSEEH